MQRNTTVGLSAVEHSDRAEHSVTLDCSGGSDKFGAVERVRNDNGEEVLLLLRQAVVHGKVPFTMKHGEERGGRWEWRGRWMAAAAPPHQL